MSKIDDYTRLSHMKDAAEEALFFINQKTRHSLEIERMLVLSLVRLIEIIGEAASRVSKEKQAQITQIPWPQVISMRNRLIHNYYEVDLDIVWKTVTEDLPPLVIILEQIINEDL
ncbi:HepT-like ribonuclease domain-containing protein [Aphanothece sacrum]|uniref:Nucleotidyltransferase n=1 Tax=Aphanothece sacrum FPU1 TaxID=1920663 RepID=A0A401IJQ3_APHSA|nr:HepT-like ribonuclease domain-containing protein [Aphanothece sacrum]GBF81528.1 nucleotidyltransferase [Aphanothece sacrum FPU1]GBF86332.1 nucleotidyltransferase [Aphanothece sacrum FPU3]